MDQVEEHLLKELDLQELLDKEILVVMEVHLMVVQVEAEELVRLEVTEHQGLLEMVAQVVLVQLHQLLELLLPMLVVVEVVATQVVQ